VLEVPRSDRILRDRYRVIRVLAEGSRAQTLLCDDTQEGRSVVVKELWIDGLDSWKHVELFEREIRVLRLVSHPGVPRVLDSFEHTEEGRTALVFVQELIEGHSLRTRVEEGPLLGEEEVARIGDGVLEILAHLHGRIPPVYHRDIKPSNIMVRPDGSPALIDFGGVCLGWRRPDDPGTTVVGTFGYMPPEQLLGQVGPRTDLYALGATLLHVVSGVPPHEFSFETGRIEVPNDLPVRPQMRRLVRALLEPAPRDRPASAAAARAILGAADEKPVEHALVPITSSRAPAVMGGVGLQFVDPGPPPRDPRGELADVFVALVDPLNEFKRRSLTGKLGAAMVLGFLSVMTAGIIPLWWLSDRSQRRARYERLFREGQFVRGTVSAVVKGGDASMYGTITYDYVVDGVNYRALIHYPEAMMAYFGAGDAVAVLYDPDEPADSCFVIRPSQPRRRHLARR
jgi:serine/threonine protein kinase